MALKVTFLGTDSDEISWGTGITLKRNKPVIVDPDDPAWAYVIRKAKHLPYFKVEEVKEEVKAAKPAQGKKHA